MQLPLEIIGHSRKSMYTRTGNKEVAVIIPVTQLPKETGRRKEERGKRKEERGKRKKRTREQTLRCKMSAAV